MIYWSSLLIPVEVMFRIKPMLVTGPTTFSGRKQMVASDAGYWVGALSDFPVVTTDQVLEWRGIIADLQGGLEDVVIGPFDHLRAPVHSGLPPVIGGIRHSDGSLFSDGSGYSQSSIKVRSKTSLALRATSATLTIDEAGPLKRGMYFTVYDGIRPSMYMITKPPEVEGNTATVRFLPTLRAPVSAGDEVDFADPKLVMNLASPDGGELSLDMGRWGRPSIELQESWNGLS
jgi:hypothetical protein